MNNTNILNRYWPSRTDFLHLVGLQCILELPLLQILVQTPVSHENSTFAPQCRCQGSPGGRWAPAGPESVLHSSSPSRTQTDRSDRHTSPIRLTAAGLTSSPNTTDHESVQEVIVTVTDSTTPSLGLNELKRARRSLAFSLSQFMLQTANRREV